MYTMNFDYGETYTLMRKFHDLGKNEVSIMDYLFQTDVYEGTYSDLAKETGIDVSNLRKCVNHLESLGIVYIVHKYYEDEVEEGAYNPMKACFIVDGWMHILLGH